MKNKIVLIIVISVLVFSIIACGESSVVVDPPSSDQQEATDSPVQPPEPLPAATVQLGTTRSNPAPVGSEIHVEDMKFVVTGMVRPADSIVTAGNMFNTEPESGQEFMFITLNVTCEKSSDQQCNYSSFNLKVLGSDGILKDAEWMLAGVDGQLEDSTFYGGATISGDVPFIVNQGDTNILLVYEPLFGDSFYLALP